MPQTSDVNKDGLYYRHWSVPSDPKGAVMLIHGLGEHCQRYEALAEFLTNAGYALCSMDLPCHGRSEGPRGHVDSFEKFQNAALSLYQFTVENHPNKRVFLLGHSMGGLIATRLLLDHQDKFQGAMLSGAAIQSPQEPPAWQVAIINTIAKLIPKLAVLKLDASKVSRDQKVVEDYMADPLVSKDKLSARFLVELTKTMEECKSRAQEITLPILIMHGSQDVMTAPEGSQLLHDSVSSTDKKIRIYEGLYHEIFNEPEAQIIFEEMTAWISKRI